MSRQAHIARPPSLATLPATIRGRGRCQTAESAMTRSQIDTFAAAVGLSLLHMVAGEYARAETSEVKVLSAIAMRSAVDELARDFERATGHKVTLTYAP